MNIGPVEQSMRENAVAARRRLMNAVRPPVLPAPFVKEVKEQRASAIPPRATPTPRSVTMAIIDEVARKHGLTKAVLISRCQWRNVATARHEAAYRLVTELGFSLPMAGRALGNRDHTTILNSLQRYIAANPGAAPGLDARNGYIGMLRTKKRERVLEMYFDHGLPPGKIGREVKVSGLAVSKWILDEIERRKAAEGLEAGQ